VEVADTLVQQEMDKEAQVEGVLDISTRPPQLHKLLEPLILVVEVAVLITPPQVLQAALASSSLRPINNEDKWKPKSIGCMELTPQCTC
jgi:hypothetical protein